jgi:DNA-binding transcriptional LysR family regulator
VWGVPNLHLQQLAYLREIERSPTMADAARRLHVSQPALSQAIAELERRLGVALLEADGRTRRLTQEGREVAAHARAILVQAEHLLERLAERRRGEGGELRVGMIDAGSLYILPEVMRRFRDDHPHVELRLSVAASAELLRALRRFELDLAFVVADPGAQEDLILEDIAQERLYMYAPPGRRERPGAADWVLYPPGSQTRERIDHGLAERGIHPRVMLESGNPQVLRQMVALGLGWSVLPAAVAEAHPEPLGRRRGRAVAVRTLCMARRRTALPDPRAESFAALARKLR